MLTTAKSANVAVRR